MTTNTPAPAMQDINAIIAKHFGDDTAGAVRAQITVNEVLSKLRSPAPAMQEAVLTDAEIREIQGTHLVTISSRDALIASVIVAGRAIEAAVLSKLRAPVADTLPLEKALYELVNKIDTGLDTGDLLQDARRASTVLDAIMTGGDLVACAYTFFKECGEDKWRERYERSLDFRIGWNACLDAIAEAQANRAALASAPVADERHAVDPCGYVAVKRSAVDWLKDKFPALTIKAGLCERIGGRLYTITRLMRDHDAALASAPVAGEARPTDRKEALRITELPNVDEALATFCSDGTQDNAVGLVLAILGSSPQASPVSEEAVYTLRVRGAIQAWTPTVAAFSIPDGEHQLFLSPAAPQASEAVRDAAFEAVRKRLCAIPRYSFYLDDDGVVRRVESRSGNWIEFDAAHELFDPVAVDAALSVQPGAQKEQRE
ncbi:hypothetical protein [Bordetella bronchiseptica]|uniref:hypothetical protein n=1 Tax=Bordetella bronchiseptica TaxID=518 RepID=UPI001CC29D51|nr:hypothetical protein [Bordetella bronchiseptica]